MSGVKKDRLGRGLGALLGEYVDSKPSPAGQAADGDVTRLPLTAIVPNPNQPRKEFNETELTELADSIRENGLLQPLVVRTSPHQSDRFELVAGERRFRSLQRLKWEEVPVMIREVDDETLLVLALVENLQREALNPIEEAEGYQSLIEGYASTQEEVARAVGKDRSTVANALRLLKLPASVRRLVNEAALTAGHGRALLGAHDPIKIAELAKAAVAGGWSVRETERRAKAERPGGGSKTKVTPPRDPVVSELEVALQESLSTRGQIRGGGKKGKGVIEVPFHSSEDFERLFALITGVEASDYLG